MSHIMYFAYYHLPPTLSLFHEGRAVQWVFLCVLGSCSRLHGSLQGQFLLPFQMVCELPAGFTLLFFAWVG